MPAIPIEGPTTLQRHWRFGRVEFDEAGFVLRMDGTVVEVERKPLEVLQVLLEHAGKVVTKSALVQQAWPGRVIGDAALAKAIGRLREAIGDADHSVVRTHHRYGYRLVADVSADVADRVPHPSIPSSMAATTTQAAHPNTEHRVLTMLFCDIVDSTHLAESLEPETFRDLLLDYQRSAAEIVRRYEGHVAQQFGDGMLFYFGYPTAHDDDAERSVRCACELLHFGARASSFTRMSLRIGVHTGVVVIGRSSPDTDALATGANLHVASRLQALAESDTVLISDATFRLVPGLFVTRDFGMQTLRGMSEPLRVHQVLRPSGARSRLDAQSRLTVFVGRDEEMALIDRSWNDVIEGAGRAVLFRGEPGIGKSRLLLEVRARLAGDAHTWLEGRADAIERLSAFHVVTELLRRGLVPHTAGQDDAQRLQALERRLDELDFERDAAIALLAPLLALPESDRYPASVLAPDTRRARTLQWLADWISRVADEQPLVLVIEDLHWCDESSLEFIGSLMTRLESLPLLLVMTARPEFVPAWPAKRLTIAPLEGLPTCDVERMVRDLATGATFSKALQTRIVERAAGIPLFVEELVRTLQETGSSATASDAVPASLDSLLRARLDRLGLARELIQTAAVIGIECDHALLQRVSGYDEARLAQLLPRLTASGLLIASGTSPASRYAFKHALIRDTAYRGLLRSARQTLHARTAEAIEALHAARLDEYCPALAFHCEQAGSTERAADFARRAGDIAMRTSANREAATHVSTAIRLLESLEPTPPRINTLLALYMSLLNLRAAMNGYTDPEVERANARAFELARGAEPSAELVPVLYWIAAISTVRGKHAVTLETYAELERLGETIGLPIARMVANFGAAQCNFVLGRLAPAEACVRQTLALYDPTTCRDVALIYGEDSRSSGSATLAWVLTLRGMPEQARTEQERSMSHARSLGLELNLAIACTLNCFGHHLAGETDAMARMARAGIALCKELAVPWYQAFCEIALATDTAQRDPAAALQDIQPAIDVLGGGGANFLLSWAYGTLADVQTQGGDLDAALHSLERSLATAEATGEAFYCAEAHRQRGDILLSRGLEGAEAAAEAEYRRAIEIARSQGASAWELRASTGLARLLQATPRAHEGRALLADVYSRFTEGFDTPDLLAAAGLLE